MSYLRIFFALWTVLVFTAPLAAQGADPIAIVKSIYPEGSQSEAAVSLQMRAPHRRALSNSLAALWKKSDDATPAEDEPVPGFDIASNSQGMEVKSAALSYERRGATHVIVVAKLRAAHPFVRHSPADNVVRYDFVRDAGGWKINDVRSAIDGKPWSLRALLTEGLKQP
jgi:hypothetical protein